MISGFVLENTLNILETLSLIEDDFASAEYAASSAFGGKGMALATHAFMMGT